MSRHWTTTVLTAIALTRGIACGGSGAGSGSPTPPPEFTLSGPEERLATDDGHFMIHFTRSGSDAASDAFVQWAAESCSLGWRELVDRGGWTAPAPDGGYGGDDRLDVVLVSMYAHGGDQTTNGRTTAPNGPGTATLWINTDIEPGSDPSKHPEVVFFTEKFVRSVFVHEFTHAAQFAQLGGTWNGDAANFLAENTAQYHAVEATDLLSSSTPKDVILIQTLLSARMGFPEKSLHDRAARRDYVPLWSKYLVDSRGGDTSVLRSIYEVLDSNGDAFAATDAVLSRTGGGLAEDFQTYAEWNYRVGERADGTGYPEADRFATLFGSVRVSATLGPAPASRKSGGDAPYGLGTNYVRFAPDPTTQDGELRFTGQFGVRWAVSVMTRDASGGPYHVERTLVGPLHTDATIPIPGWNDKTDLVAVVSNLTVDGSANTHQASYALETAGRVTGG